MIFSHALTRRKIATVAVFGTLLVFGAVGISMGQRGGGPNAPDQKILKDFDADQDGVLNKTEREKAKEFLAKSQRSGFFGGRSGGRRGGPPGGPGGRGGAMPTGKAGPRVDIEDAATFPNAELYDQSVLRTFFFEFEQDDWEKELATFKPTDVEIPCEVDSRREDLPKCRS